MESDPGHRGQPGRIEERVVSFGTKVVSEIEQAIDPLLRNDRRLAGLVLEATVSFLGPRMRKRRQAYSVETLTGVLRKLADHPDTLRLMPDLRAFVHRELREAEEPLERPNPLRHISGDIARNSNVDRVRPRR